MNNTTKFLIGFAMVGVAAYMFWKQSQTPKKSADNSKCMSCGEK